jgi:stage V sporulation protein G
MTIKAEITRTFEDKAPLLASAAVIFEAELPSGKSGRFIVKNLRVIEGRNGVFVAMPNFRGRENRFVDTAFPLDNDMREEIRQLVLGEYDAAKERGE